MTARRELPPGFVVPAFRVHDALEAGVTRSRLSAADVDASIHGARITRLGRRLDGIQSVLGEGQAFTGPTAATIWGMPLPRRWQEDERVWVSTLGRDRSMRRPGVVASRRSSGGGLSVDGYTVLDPARTWCSLGPILASHDLVAVGDRIVTEQLKAPRLATLKALEDAVAASRRGVRDLRSALREVRVGAWSRPESLLRVALLRAGLPEPALNTEVRIARGRVVYPDLSWPGYLVCAEYDGGWHDDRRQRALDLERHEALADLGWLVVRFRARDLFPEPIIAVARVLRRLSSRGYRHPSRIERAEIAGWMP